MGLDHHGKFQAHLNALEGDVYDFPRSRCARKNGFASLEGNSLQIALTLGLADHLGLNLAITTEPHAIFLQKRTDGQHNTCVQRLFAVRHGDLSFDLDLGLLAIKHYQAGAG